MVSPLSFNTSAFMPRGLNVSAPQGPGGLSGGGLGLNASAFSGIGGGTPGLDAASLHQMGVSSSSLMLMAQINMMMASVLSGIGMLMQQIMASVQQRQQAGAVPGGTGTVSTTAGGNNPGGSSATSSSGAPGGATGAAPAGSNSAMDRLAAAGRQSAAKRGTTGMCLAGVNDALEAAGLGVERKPSAYMAADVLARDGRFKEINVGQGQLASLPPGCIIVWNRGAGHEHGHIAITQPGGKETSDHEQNLITNYGTSFRVFMPQG